MTTAHGGSDDRSDSGWKGAMSKSPSWHSIPAANTPCTLPVPGPGSLDSRGYPRAYRPRLASQS